MAILILILIFAASLQAQTVVTIVGPASATARETITASIDLSGDPATALQFEVPPNSVVTLGAAAVAAGKTLACADTISSRRCLIFGLNANLLTGPAASLVFPGQTTLGPITLTATSVIVVDTEPNAGAAVVTLSGLSINILSPCDLNSDGAVDVGDLLSAVQQALGTMACGNADINTDGACNVIDIQVLANVSLGLLACPL